MGMGCLPSQLLEETAFYHNIRKVISSARHEAEQWRKENKKRG